MVKTVLLTPLADIHLIENPVPENAKLWLSQKKKRLGSWVASRRQRFGNGGG
jgi:hypothetical protein